jgi:hypothetical protein
MSEKDTAITPPAPEDMSLSERNAAERDYYLGKTKVIPFTDGKTVAEGKEEYQAAVKAQEADLKQRMERYVKSDEPAPAGDPVINDTQLPTGEELSKMSKNDLVEQAAAEEVDVEAGDNKAEIIQKIVGGRAESSIEKIDPENNPRSADDEDEASG